MLNYTPPRRHTAAHHRNMAALLLKEARYEVRPQALRILRVVRRHLSEAHRLGFKLL